MPGEFRDLEREATFCAQASYSKAICLELGVQFGQNLLYRPRQISATLNASPSAPPQRGPRAAQGNPKGTRGRSKERKSASKDREGKATNHRILNYTHIHRIYANSRSSAMLRPATMLICIYIYIYIYIYIDIYPPTSSSARAC